MYSKVSTVASLSWSGCPDAHLTALSELLGRSCAGFRLVFSTPRYTQPPCLLRALHRRQTGKAWSHETLRWRQGSQACSLPFRRRPGVPSAEAGVEDGGGSMIRSQNLQYNDTRPDGVYTDSDQIRSPTINGPLRPQQAAWPTWLLEKEGASVRAVWVRAGLGLTQPKGSRRSE